MAHVSNDDEQGVILHICPLVMSDLWGLLLSVLTGHG